MRYFIILFILFFSNNLLAEQTYRFRDKDFQEIKKIYNIQKNKFSLEQINDLVKEIGKNKNITVAKVNFENGYLTLDIKESASPQIFEVNGNQAITSPEIFSLLEIRDPQRVDKTSIEKNLYRIKEKYDSIGMRKVTLNLTEKNENNLIQHILEINEGTTATLKEISVLSNNPFLNNHIRYKLSSFLNKKIDKSLIKNIDLIVSDILIKNRYLDAKIAKISPIYNLDRTSARITISIETTATYEFLFYGNKFFSSGNLLSHLDLEKNFLNYIKNQKLLQRNIENYYRSAGFAKINVESKIHFYEKLGKYVLQFNIKEGPQIRIKEIEISGKISRNPQYYRDLIYKNLSDYKNAGFFIEDNIVKATDRMILQLKDEGYLRAEKISLEYQFPREDSVIIQMQISENILTQIRNISFAGLKNFTSSQLYDVIELKPNSPLNLVKLYNSYSALRAFYQKNGYLEFEILSAPEKLIKYVDNYEFADISFEFKEGPQIHIKDVLVRGNTFTKDKVAIRELDLKPGEVLTSEKINDSIIFLERTQLFSRAQINTSDVNTNISDRSVYVDVQEKNPGLLSSGLGLSNEFSVTVRSYLGLSYQNLAGTGRGLSGRGDIKYSLDPLIDYPENRIVLGYYEPFLFFNRLRARISLEREQLVFDVDRDSNTVTLQEKNEINFLLEKQINRRLKLIWHVWDLSNLRFFDRATGDDKSKITIANIGPAIELDKRDDIFVPRDGTFSVAQVEYSNPALGSTDDVNNYIDFVKLTAGHIRYSPLTANKRWVLVNEVRAGYVDNLSDRPQSGIPGARLFFLGGRSTLRGYDLRDNERVPSLKEVCGDACTTISDFKVSTASHFYLTKNEVRFPINGDNFGGLIFYDGGAVFIDGLDIQDHYRDTAGFGFRYITPIGAFTGEVGFKLDKKKNSDRFNNENAFTIHFSMGTF
jgi:outer membrane protein insertion porin family